MVSVVEGFPCEGATQLLAELREALQFFLLKMAAVFPNRTHQLVFLINNYDLILRVLKVSKVCLHMYMFSMLKEYKIMLRLSAGKNAR